METRKSRVPKIASFHSNALIDFFNIVYLQLILMLLCDSLNLVIS